MTLIIVTMLIIAYVLIWGSDFVMDQHPGEYMEWLAGNQATSESVKYFIEDHVFLKYVGEAAAIVLFLLATMSIVELLNNNGCFDFITEWIRTRNSKRLPSSQNGFVRVIPSDCCGPSRWLRSSSLPIWTT